MKWADARRCASKRTVFLGALIALFFVLFATQSAQAIPVFSRKYRTSCITCHAGFPKLNSVGEAFRRNGYQFPQDDDILVKDEPIPMGSEHYKEMWPNSLWPNDIPHLPPLSLRARLGYFQALANGPGNNEPSSDFRFPMDYSLMSGGTLGKDISFYANVILAGRGGHGGEGGGHGGMGEAAGLESSLERVFVQFDNLFAWSEEDDEDGMRLGRRWITLPRHAMVLRVGQFEPLVIAPWASIHRQLSITPFLPNLATIGGNSFSFEPAQRGLELNGIIRQYNSYSIGLGNGNGVETAWDNNSQKDYYFRINRKWWGFPLDGVLGQAELVDDEAMSEAPGEDEMAPIGLDFWREIQFQTGFFGYFGRNEASVTVEDHVELRLADGGVFDLDVPRTITRPDRFERLGFDVRWQYQDLDIYGVWVYGWNSDPISDEDPNVIMPDEMMTWFVEADYYFKPWFIGYSRYEELTFRGDEREAEAGIKRGIIGVAAYIRVNMRLNTEFVVDARGNGTTGDTLKMVLDFAY